MKKHILFAVISFLISFFVLVLITIFATAAMAFDGIDVGNVLYISFYGVPVWAIIGFFIVVGLVFSAIAFRKRKN